jgi:DNA polymerase-3 subunit gamma/tau
MATALLGYTDSALLDDVVDAFAAGDGAAAFEVVDRVIEGGHDPRRFVADLLERLRDLVILAAVPDALEKGLIDAPADVVERMLAQAGAFGAAELSRAADLVNTGLTEMRGATAPRLHLELICARVLLPAAYGDERAWQARLERLERRPQPDPAAFLAGPPVQAPHAAGPGQGQVYVQPRPHAQPSAPAPGAAYEPAATPPAATPPPAAPAPAPQAPAPQPAGPQSAARRPGAWPTAAPPGAATPAPQSPQAPSPQAPPAPAPAPPGPGGDPSRVRQLWPQILDAVKNRRRFTWILLDQNAQVVGFDGTTLQVGFTNPGARDSFLGSGSEEVLRQAISDALGGTQWRIEALVQPSGGAGQPSGGGAVRAPQAPPAYAPPAPAATYAPPAPQQQPAQAGPPAPAAQSPQAPPARRPEPQAAQQQQRPPAPRPQAAPEPPPPVDVEYDMPEDDDPDLDEAALSGHELIVRELGATVIEEIPHE